jgi:Ser/Thr protein kinase RdoA (MazF antagonist)
MPAPRDDHSPGYADLTPTQVLDALDAVGLRGDGRILQLNSYENRVFQVFLEDGSAVVAKFYRPGRWSDAQILEEHAFALELDGAEVPVVPPLALHRPYGAGTTALASAPQTLACVQAEHTMHRFSVSKRCAGRAPELDDPSTLQWLGRFIARMHAVGRQKPFEHRHHMRPSRDARTARDFLLNGHFVADTQVQSWRHACDAAIELLEQTFERIGPRPQLRLHGDCHPGNVLWREEGPHVVDLDDACMGPAVQDLWMLVSGDADSMAQQMRLLLKGYRQFMPFDERELALIEPLRTLRMVRHSAWLAARWTDPSFPLAFPWFDTAAYWSEQTTQLREQSALMQAQNLG